MKQLHFLIIFIGVTVCFACERETDKLQVKHDISFYTLQDNNTWYEDCSLNFSQLQEKENIISSHEILSYSTEGHYFTLTAAAINRLKNIRTKVPFYLKVDSKVVYSGFFMPGYLSLSCPGVIVIDPISYSNNNIQVRFDYANYLPGIGQKSADFRNHETLLKALQEEGKLNK